MGSRLDNRFFKEVVQGQEMKYVKSFQTHKMESGMKNALVVCKEDEKLGERRRKTIVVDGEENEEILEWLQRSIIGETSKPINFNLLEERLFFEWRCITNVREMGAYRALVTFATKEDREEALNAYMDLLLKSF